MPKLTQQSPFLKSSSGTCLGYHSRVCLKQGAVPLRGPKSKPTEKPPSPPNENAGPVGRSELSALISGVSVKFQMGSSCWQEWGAPLGGVTGPMRHRFASPLGMVTALNTAYPPRRAPTRRKGDLLAVCMLSCLGLNPSPV